MRILQFLLAAGLCLLIGSTRLVLADEPASDWRYVASSEEPGFARPLFRAIALSTDKPEDLKELLTYRGPTQRYAQLRYGTASSLRVVIVLDEVSRSDFDLYVDVDRDRTIIAREKVAGSGRLRQIELDAELSQGDDGSDMLPRQVAFRRGISSKSLSFATLGYLEGSVAVDGQPRRARRVDGDGDGLFSATRDRVWLDLNGDDQWDAFAEQFPFLPILKLDGTRYALRGDRAGKRLAIDELSGTGAIRLALSLHDRKAEIVALEVMLVGSDGSAVALQGTDQAVTVPIGEYTVNTVRCIAKDSATGRLWNFVFSAPNLKQAERTFTVAREQEVSIDPIGKLRFQAENARGRTPVKPGGSVNVNPRLYTADGLLINTSSCGTTTAASVRESNAAIILLRDGKGQQLSAGRSGFA